MLVALGFVLVNKNKKMMIVIMKKKKDEYN